MKSRKISLIALALVLIMGLTACTNEASLVKAFKKQQEITAFKSQTDLKMNMEATGLSEENQMVFDILKEVVNTTEIRVDQKTISENKGQDAKGKLYFTIKNKGKTEKATIWVDVEAGKTNKPKVVEIFKLPASVMGLLGPETANKEYLVYDVNELLAQAGEDDSSQEIMTKAMDWAIKAQPEIEKSMESYIKDFKFDEKLASKKPSQTINGEKLDMYEVKMNDKQAKDFFRYSVNKALDNKEIAQLFSDYLDLISEISVTPDLIEENQADMKTGIEILKDTKTIKEGFNKFMDSLDKVTILGEKGLVMEFGVNKDGYMAYEAGNLNFQIDLGQISSLNENIEEKQTGKINLNFDYKTSLSQINDKALTVDMPKTTKENSISFVELMKNMEKQMEEATKALEEKPEVIEAVKIEAVK